MERDSRYKTKPNWNPLFDFFALCLSVSPRYFWHFSLFIGGLLCDFRVWKAEAAALPALLPQFEMLFIV